MRIPLSKVPSSRPVEAFTPRSEVRGARPPRALPGMPSCPAGCAQNSPGHLEFFRAPDVFREGAENCARGGRAPHSISEFGFTMVEIALALAIVGFALVAIIGVLPQGLNVQKENREDTVINQDATLFMNAIRSGDQGYDELTNFVERITVNRTYYAGPAYDSPAPLASIVGSPVTRNGTTLILTNGGDIIGLLSTPRYQAINNVSRDFISNHVVAFVRAISGNASEKVSRANEVRDLSFSYRLISEITPPNFTDYYNQIRGPVGNAYARNLHDVRLVFSWPLIPPRDINLNMPTNVGSSRLVYRTQVGGTMGAVPISVPDNQFFFFLNPDGTGSFL